MDSSNQMEQAYAVQEKLSMGAQGKDESSSLAEGNLILVLTKWITAMYQKSFNRFCCYGNGFLFISCFHQQWRRFTLYFYHRIFMNCSNSNKKYFLSGVAIGLDTSSTPGANGVKPKLSSKEPNVI